MSEWSEFLYRDCKSYIALTLIWFFEPSERMDGALDDTKYLRRMAYILTLLCLTLR